MEFEERSKLLEQPPVVETWSETVILITGMAQALDKVARAKKVIWSGYYNRKRTGDYNILATIELFTKHVLEMMDATGRLPSPEMLEDMALGSLAYSP